MNFFEQGYSKNGVMKTLLRDLAIKRERSTRTLNKQRGTFTGMATRGGVQERKNWQSFYVNSTQPKSRSMDHYKANSLFALAVHAEELSPF